MYRMKLGIAVALLCLTVAGVRAEDENPFKNAKVGDWVSYLMKVEMGDKVMKAEMKQTVTAKTDKDVTFDSVTTIDGQESKGAPTTVKLDQKFDPLQLPEGAKVKEVATGDEKLTVAGKSFDAKWRQIEVTIKVGEQDTTTKAKVWTAATVPITTIVKLDTDGGEGKMSMELKDFGSK
jgi:hypothetical protein